MHSTCLCVLRFSVVLFFSVRCKEIWKFHNFIEFSILNSIHLCARLCHICGHRRNAIDRAPAYVRHVINSLNIYGSCVCLLPLSISLKNPIPFTFITIWHEKLTQPMTKTTSESKTNFNINPVK